MKLRDYVISVGGKWPEEEKGDNYNIFLDGKADGYNRALDKLASIEVPEPLRPLDEDNIYKEWYKNHSLMHSSDAIFIKSICSKFGQPKQTLPSVEEIAKELHWIQGINSNPKLRERAWNICHTKDDYFKDAEAIVKFLEERNK